ncbi:hypothetical protein [Diaminobutyricimonas sp. TR449]|uniref:hypothetical protein n=1 Tax=Diaminobutyricimonas sp. TR449 TaxID=2708076 RepID=UPI001420F399|nr:hypothetical protein [Diaminobutyricimonas sp. TR449]
MTARAFLEIGMAFLIAIVLLFVFAGVVRVLDGADAATAFFDQGPRFIAGTLALALPLWMILLVIGAALTRNRSRRRKVGIHLASSGIVGLLNVVAFSLIGAASGGWGTLLTALALGATAIFIASAAMAILVTYFAIFRRPPRPLPL